MDDPLIYENFIRNVAGVATNRNVNEVLSFADTFRMLLSTSEKELDTFVKNTHAANSARANNAKILISTSAVMALKAVMFELKDRDMCDALPNAAMLTAIDANQVSLLRAQRTQALQDIAQENSLSLTTSMEIPKLTATNYETFMTAFTTLASRTKGASGTTLDYLMREVNGNYDAPGWASRAARLKACTKLNGARYIRDRESLYLLFVEHVGSEGVGSDIVNRFKTSKNGHACYNAFNAHFKNASFLENKASSATAAMSNAVYKGDRQHFTIETYYSIMSKAFNDLELAGAAHSLSEQQKITKFEQGLKDNNAISWSITAKNVWNSLPVANQTFDAYYNEFSQYMTKFKTMSSQNNRTTRIAAFNTGRGRGRSGRGRSGRGGRLGGRGRGRGRSKGGRSNNSYSPYSLASQYGNFQPQAKLYSDDEWAALNPHQKRMVQDLKGREGWINGQTPPAGCTIDQHGFATATTALVSAVQRSISAASTSSANNIVPLPPPPASGNTMEPPPNRVPPIINTNASTAGSAFGRSGTRVNPQSNDGSSVSQVSLVSINGQAYNGPIYDSHGTRIA